MLPTLESYNGEKDLRLENQNIMGIASGLKRVTLRKCITPMVSGREGVEISSQSTVTGAVASSEGYVKIFDSAVGPICARDDLFCKRATVNGHMTCSMGGIRLYESQTASLEARDIIKIYDSTTETIESVFDSIFIESSSVGAIKAHQEATAKSCPSIQSIRAERVDLKNSTISGDVYAEDAKISQCEIKGTLHYSGSKLTIYGGSIEHLTVKSTDGSSPVITFRGGNTKQVTFEGRNGAVIWYSASPLPKIINGRRA